MPSNLLRAVLVTAAVAAGVAAATIAPYALVGAVLLAGGAAAALTADPLTPRRLPRQVQPIARLARRAHRRVQPVARRAAAAAAPVARRAVAASGARVRGLRHAGEQGALAAVRQLGPARLDLGQLDQPHPLARPQSAERAAGVAEEVIGLSEVTAEHRRLAQAEQAKAAAADDPQVRADALAAAARHLDQVHHLELELTGLRAEPPPCPECDAYLGWHPSRCATCAAVAGQSPPPTVDTSTAEPDPTDRKASPMSTPHTSDTRLGTAGQASTQGLVVDWESSVEARQHPETFIAWLQAQAASAGLRAQMVPELVATYHGRGPSGHAGVPDTQIVAFTQRYAEAAEAEAEAYGAWAAEYGSYVEVAQLEMTSSFGREVIGAAHAAHQGP